MKFKVGDKYKYTDINDEEIIFTVLDINSPSYYNLTNFKTDRRLTEGTIDDYSFLEGSMIFDKAIPLKKNYKNL